MKDLIIQKLREILETSSWDTAILKTKFKPSGSSNPHLILIKNGNESRFDGFEIFDVNDIISEYYEQSKSDNAEKFNVAEIEITYEGQVKTKFLWDEGNEIENKIKQANLFPQWINERMIMLIYEHEFPNGPTDLDDDGEPTYNSTWDSGVFTFLFKENKMTGQVQLTKDGEERTIDQNFPDYFIEALLEHYELTNNGEIRNRWEPWNKLVIHSPHNDLPYGRFDEFVFYSLEG